MATEPKASKPIEQVIDAFNRSMCRTLPYVDDAKQDPESAALAAAAPPCVTQGTFGSADGWARVHVIVDGAGEDDVGVACAKLLRDLKTLRAARYIRYPYPYRRDHQVFGQMEMSLMRLGAPELHLDVAIPGGLVVDGYDYGSYPTNSVDLAKLAQQQRHGN